MTTRQRSFEPTIEVRGLRKHYGDQTVLDGIDLSVRPGEIYALLGPNGAGKTTTVDILATLVKPDAGSALVGGHDVLAHPAAAREAFALTGQYAAVDGFQTGRENLRMAARLHHLSGRRRTARVAELLEAFDLTGAADKPSRGYSGGLLRRLDLAISLVSTPRVLFLDEPTTGLDPRSRAQLWTMVRDLADDGTTVLLTTQYLDEAERLADRVGVLDGGSVIAEGTPERLKAQVSGDHLEFTLAEQEDLEAASRLRADAETDRDELRLRMPTTDAVADIRAFLADCARDGIHLTDIAVVGPSLDDVYFSLTGRGTSSDDDTEKAA